MFYHIKVGMADISHILHKNKSREDALANFVCPFINCEITFFENRLINMSFFESIEIFQTTKPIDSDWPVKEEEKNWITLESEIIEALENESQDVTPELYREAITLIESGQYKELRARITEGIKGTYSFFVCPLENEEVKHNYEFVIKPAVRQFQFEIQKADEISHTGTITDAILTSINRSRFLVADLTDAKPNCYYEVGYAHALGKPVIILAKNSTTRHFDISTYKWNFWADYKDLKTKFETELRATLRSIGITAAGEPD